MARLKLVWSRIVEAWNQPVEMTASKGSIIFSRRGGYFEMEKLAREMRNLGFKTILL